MCFLRSAATVEMGNDRCVGVISQTTKTSKHKGNPARNPVLNLLRPLFRLYDEIGTSDICTPEAELMHVIIPTNKSHLSTKIHDCTYSTSRWRIYLNFNENGGKVRACAGRDTAPLRLVAFQARVIRRCSSRERDDTTLDLSDACLKH